MPKSKFNFNLPGNELITPIDCIWSRTTAPARPRLQVPEESLSRASRRRHLPFALHLVLFVDVATLYAPFYQRSRHLQLALRWQSRVEGPHKADRDRSCARLPAAALVDAAVAAHEVAVADVSVAAAVHVQMLQATQLRDALGPGPAWRQLGVADQNRARGHEPLGELPRWMSSPLGAPHEYVRLTQVPF